MSELTFGQREAAIFSGLKNRKGEPDYQLFGRLANGGLIGTKREGKKGYDFTVADLETARLKWRDQFKTRTLDADHPLLEAGNITCAGPVWPVEDMEEFLSGVVPANQRPAPPEADAEPTMEELADDYEKATKEVAAEPASREEWLENKLAIAEVALPKPSPKQPKKLTLAGRLKKLEADNLITVKRVIKAEELVERIGVVIKEIQRELGA